MGWAENANPRSRRNNPVVNLWLDDYRPAPIGWVHVMTVQEAQPYLAAGTVKRASLDHDLGACDACLEQWREADFVAEMPNCEHFGTGYTLVCWMEATGRSPQEKPTVHSANPVGAKRMRQAIDREWARRAELPPPESV